MRGPCGVAVRAEALCEERRAAEKATFVGRWRCASHQASGRNFRMLPKGVLIGLGLLAGFAAWANPNSSAPAEQGGAPRRAQIGAWGLDLTTHDTTVKPGDDFFRYATGHWMDTHEIPADRSRWGAFDALDEDAQNRVHTLIEALA